MSAKVVTQWRKRRPMKRRPVAKESPFGSPLENRLATLTQYMGSLRPLVRAMGFRNPYFPSMRGANFYKAVWADPEAFWSSFNVWCKYLLTQYHPDISKHPKAATIAKNITRGRARVKTILENRTGAKL